MPDPIIFLPGFMCDGRLFQEQKSILSRKGYICLDGDITRSASIESIAKDVLIDAPDTFSLIGLSMGGIVALEIIRQAPERVAHLGLLNTTAHADKIQDQRKSQICRVADGELSLVMQEELKPNYLAEINRTSERLNLLSDMGLKLGEEVFARQSIALMSRCSAYHILPNINCPTLVMTGRDDIVCTPEIHVEIANTIPNASLSIIADCGHLSSIEQSKIVANAIDSLLKQRARSTKTERPIRNGLSCLRLVEN